MSATERSFGETHFGAAELGNISRTRRLVAIADAFCRHPDGTLPHKLKDPAALRATYRLMERPEVTHTSVLAAHQAETYRRIAAHDGPLLAICDATELDFSGLTSIHDLGQIGQGKQRGYVCQNVLIVDPRERSTLGLANQILHRRACVPVGEVREQSRQRKSRESRLWPEGTKNLPVRADLFVVCDRGGDTFEELEHESRSGRRFVIRSRQDRNSLCGHTDQATQGKLYELTRAAKPRGRYTVEVAATHGRTGRTATVQVSYMAVQLIPPKQARGHHGQEPLSVWVVRVWERDPPPGEEPLEWHLLTNEPVEDLATARRIISYYECRWVVEEYHKAQKTGCNIENLQFSYSARLEPMIALLSIVALTLLNLRDASRRPDAKTKPASELVAQEYVNVLSLWRTGETRTDWTIHDFFFALARLGGHQNRIHDHPPGWLVLWRGWNALQLIVVGRRLDQKRKKLGQT